VRISVCNSCGARIIWARTVTGKKMPIDADPVGAEEGGIELEIDPERDEPVEPLARVLGYVTRVAREAVGIPIYRSHFASCPNAAAHRKKARP
jgi:hypothetical protein